MACHLFSLKHSMAVLLLILIGCVDSPKEVNSRNPKANNQQSSALDSSSLNHVADRDRQSRDQQNENVKPYRMVFATSSECSDFSGTILALHDNKFKYWFYTDVSFPDEEKIIYPIEGKYSSTDDSIILHSPDVNQLVWYKTSINGRDVLMREDALRYWKDRNLLYDYGILIRCLQIPSDLEKVKRPSITVLHDNDMKRNHPVWKDPFLHQ